MKKIEHIKTIEIIHPESGLNQEFQFIGDDALFLNLNIMKSTGLLEINEGKPLSGVVNTWLKIKSNSLYSYNYRSSTPDFEAFVEKERKVTKAWSEYEGGRVLTNYFKEEMIYDGSEIPLISGPKSSQDKGDLDTLFRSFSGHLYVIMGRKPTGWDAIPVIIQISRTKERFIEKFGDVNFRDRWQLPDIEKPIVRSMLFYEAGDSKDLEIIYQSNILMLSKATEFR